MNLQELIAQYIIYRKSLGEKFKNAYTPNYHYRQKECRCPRFTFRVIWKRDVEILFIHGYLYGHRAVRQLHCETYKNGTPQRPERMRCLWVNAAQGNR